MDKVDMIFDMLKSLDEKTDDVVESQIRVEADLKYHIKRTDLLQTEVAAKITRPTIRQVAAVISIIGGLIGIALALKVI